MWETARFVVALAFFPFIVVDEFLHRGDAAQAEAAQRKRFEDLAEGR